MITSETVPVRSKNVVTRKDADGVLLFQVLTDEMYFVPEAGYALLSLCDGSRTLAEIEELLARRQPELGTTEAREMITRFINDLTARHVLELWG